MKPKPLIVKETEIKPIDYSKIKHARCNYGHHDDELEDKTSDKEETPNP